MLTLFLLDLSQLPFKKRVERIYEVYSLRVLPTIGLWARRGSRPTPRL